jgi:hypothetical protein
VYLHTFLEVLPCTEGRSLYRPLWYENWIPQPRAGFRSINVLHMDPIMEIAHDRHRVLQHRLAAYFSYSLSVSFPYTGEVAGRA